VTTFEFSDLCDHIQYYLVDQGFRGSDSGRLECQKWSQNFRGRNSWLFLGGGFGVRG
jgi:hypothetical protein